VAVVEPLVPRPAAAVPDADIIADTLCGLTGDVDSFDFAALDTPAAAPAADIVEEVFFTNAVDCFDFAAFDTPAAAWEEALNSPASAGTCDDDDADGLPALIDDDGADDDLDDFDDDARSGADTLITRVYCHRLVTRRRARRRAPSPRCNPRRGRSTPTALIGASASRTPAP